MNNLAQVAFQDKITNAVFVTYNYEQFTFLNGNRNINKCNLKNIEKSFKREQVIVPIIVNQNLEIIDGQHRFLICQENNYPLYYIIVQDAGLKQCEIINTAGRKWNNDDYLESYCDQGNKHYIILKQFAEKHGLSAAIARTFLEFSAYSHNSAQIFAEGNFIVKDLSKSERYYDQYQDFHACEPFKHTGFIRVLMSVFNTPIYNHERMVQKLKHSAYKIKIRSFHYEYKELLTDVYNYKTKESEKVQFNL